MKQIIALGGGGFSMEPDNPLLDSYILAAANKERPKICFIPTASGDADNYIQRFYNAFKKMNCDPSHLSLFQLETRDIEAYILDKDIIYVGGGSTINMLALWRQWGLDSVLKKAYEQGIVLAGLSAGSNCWYEEAVTDIYGDGQLNAMSCLGILSGSHCPHYDGEEARRPNYYRLIANKEIQEGMAADDGAGLHYINGELVKVVSSRPNAYGYKVSLVKNEIIEEKLETIYLGEEKGVY